MTPFAELIVFVGLPMSGAVGFLIGIIWAKLNAKSVEAIKKDE